MIWLLFLFFICHASRHLLLIPEIKSKISYFLSCKHFTNIKEPLTISKYVGWWFAFPQTYAFSLDSVELNQNRVKKYKTPFDIGCFYFDFFEKRPFSIEVYNDAYNIKGRFTLSFWRSFYAHIKRYYFRSVKEAEFCCWDAYCDGSYLYAAIATDHYITFLSVSNIFGFHAQRELFSYYHDKQIDQRQSLCFHNCSDQKVVSLINKNSMKVFSLDSKCLSNRILCPLVGVFKHEYIGGGTYLLLADCGLYFAEVKNNMLEYYKQTIKDKNGKELFVQNFAVNHEYKTDSARARFFVVVASNQLFLCDLLERYKNGVLRMQKLSDSFVPEDVVSFVGNNIFCLNQMSSSNYSLLHMTLDSCWVVKKMFESGRFSQSEANTVQKKNYFGKKIYNFLYEQKYFIISWVLFSWYIFHYCHNYNKNFSFKFFTFFVSYYLSVFVYTILERFFISNFSTPVLRQKFFLPLHIILPLLPLKIRNFIRYGVWS